MFTRIVCLLLIVAGIGLSGALLQRHFELAYSEDPEKETLCSAFSGDCDKAFENSVSRQFGIPLAGWGIVYYGTLGALLLLGLAMGASFRQDTAVAAFFISVAGAAVSIWLLYLMFSERVPFCPICAIMHFSNLFMVLLLKRLTGLSLLQLFGRVRSALAFVFAGRAENPAPARWKLVGFFFPAMLALVLYQWVALEERKRASASEVAFDEAKLLAEYQAQPRHEISYGPDTPTKGPDTAPVRVVAFGDLECEGCANTAAFLDELRRRYGDEKIQIAFKHFPLSTECNPAATSARRRFTCGKAEWAIAGHAQGHFWDMHDWYYGLNPAFEGEKDGVSLGFIMKRGMNVETFQADVKSSKTAQILKDNVDEGARLGVSDTPAVFVNGRRASSARRPLELIVKYELQKTEALPGTAPASDGHDHSGHDHSEHAETQPEVPQAESGQTEPEQAPAEETAADSADDAEPVVAPRP